MNVGSLFRSAHAFGAGFVFTVDAQYDRGEGRKADTSGTPDHVPFYSFPDVESLVLPARCDLVGIELVPGASELPSFRHPLQAAYVLGPERGSLSLELQALCAYTVQIPTKFCVNVGIAGAIAMYDRVISLGRYPRRPVTPGVRWNHCPSMCMEAPRSGVKWKLIGRTARWPNWMNTWKT